MYFNKVLLNNIKTKFLKTETDNTFIVIVRSYRCVHEWGDVKGDIVCDVDGNIRAGSVLTA